MIFPDATTLLDYALVRMNAVIENLVVRVDRVDANLKAAGAAVFSGHYLLALVERGISREEAYQWVQECALVSLEKRDDFVKTVLKHDRIRKVLGEKKIRELGSLPYQLRNVREIYQRALRAESN